jgi:hypothetical protein
MEQAVSSMFVLGSTRSRSYQEKSRTSNAVDLASLSPQELGGIEYRALRVLLKLTTGKYNAAVDLFCTYVLRVFLRPPSLRRHLSCALDPPGESQVQGLPRLDWPK